MATSAFRGVIEFLGDMGVYDVILPFLLVFTIVFAILEKTKILGTAKEGGETIGKKNLNSMVALSIAFLAVASTKIVSVINSAMANIVLLILLGFSFLLLVGIFFKDKELDEKKILGGWTGALIAIMFVGVIVVFLNAMDWLNPIFDLFANWETEYAMNLFFFAIVVFFIWFITKGDSKPKEKKEKKEDKE